MIVLYIFLKKVNSPAGLLFVGWVFLKLQNIWLKILVIDFLPK